MAPSRAHRIAPPPLAPTPAPLGPSRVLPISRLQRHVDTVGVGGDAAPLDRSRRHGAKPARGAPARPRTLRRHAARDECRRARADKHPSNQRGRQRRELGRRHPAGRAGDS
eukprot:685373-Prymnesium_polylepis.1